MRLSMTHIFIVLHFHTTTLILHKFPQETLFAIQGFLKAPFTGPFVKKYSATLRWPKIKDKTRTD